MRISTGQMFHQNTTSILQKQTSTNKILDQLSTGKKINTAGDDPVAAIVIDNLKQKNVSICHFHLSSIYKNSSLVHRCSIHFQLE